VLALGTGALVAQQLLSLAVSILTAPFLPAVIVLLYYDRRVRTEALDVQLATGRLKLSRA
jgi:Na+/proline symporter